MFLARLYIENYRSIRQLDLYFARGKNVILGRNNTGKSNIIKALNILLGEGSPTYAKSENIGGSDFFSWKEDTEGQVLTKSADYIYIWCELHREVGEALNYDELYKCYGFYVYGSNRTREPFRFPHRDLPKDRNLLFDINQDDRSTRFWVDPKLRNQQTFEQQFEDKHSIAYAFLATKDQNGTISKEIRLLYRETDDSDWIMAFTAPIRNEFLQSAIIPSFRDPQNQLRLTTYTWYGKLMQHLTSKHTKSVELQTAFEAVRLVADEIFSSLKQTVAESSLKVAFPGTELSFQFNPDTRTELFKACLIYIDDGFKSPLAEKGSGIQSATIIGLFTYYTQYVNTSTAALLCVEEPELYLHPHARRVISDRLDDFLGGNRNQVIITTHSVEFVRSTADTLTVIIARKGSTGTVATGLDVHEYRDLLINNNQNELFFADTVVICEGLDDYIIRMAAKELFPRHLDEENVSIISAGTKDNIARLAKLVLKLGLKCLIFADFDYLLRDRDEARRAYGAKAHDSVVSLGEQMFRQQCTFGAFGPKVLGRLQRLRADLKKQDERAFYLAKTSDDFDSRSLRIALPYLRSHGIGILNGEIEHLSKDASLLSPERKLSLDTVFELNARVLSGTPLSSLLELDQIREFLGAVFPQNRGMSVSSATA